MRKPKLKNRPHHEEIADRDKLVSSRLTRVAFASSACLFAYGLLVAYWKSAPAVKLPNVSAEYSQLMAFFVATALSIFTGVLGFIYELRVKLDLYGDHLTRAVGQMDDQLAQAVDQIDNVIDLRYLGQGQQSVNPILDRIKNAQSIRNTLVFFDLSERDLAFASYVKGDIYRIQDAIGTLLTKGGSWTDILSQDAVNSEHLDWLKPWRDRSKGGILPANQSSKPFQSSPSEAERDHYVIRCLNESYPVLNFMILQYGDGDEEVIFGQGHHSEDPSGRVYLSRNAKLIETFERYWRVLERDSTPFVPGRTKPMSAVDIRGMWLRACLKVPQDWWAVNGLPSADSPCIDFAFVKIYIAKNRRLVVDAHRYQACDDLRRQAGFHSIATDLDDTRLWFATETADKNELNRAGWYRFIRPSDFDNKSLKIREFYGEFRLQASQEASQDHDSRNFPASNEKLMVVGERLDLDLLRGLPSYDKLFPNGIPSSVDTDFVDDPTTQSALNQLAREWWEVRRARNLSRGGVAHKVAP